MSVDGWFAGKLSERLLSMEGDCIEAVIRGLPPEGYQRLCGQIELLRAIRNDVIPEVIKDMRKE